MNAMSNNMWAGMTMIEEIERGTLNRFLASPASRIGIMNATVAEQAVSTTVQSLIIVVLGLAGGARYHGGLCGRIGCRDRARQNGGRHDVGQHRLQARLLEGAAGADHERHGQH